MSGRSKKVSKGLGRNSILESLNRSFKGFRGRSNPQNFEFRPRIGVVMGARVLMYFLFKV